MHALRSSALSLIVLLVPGCGGSDGSDATEPGPLLPEGWPAAAFPEAPEEMLARVELGRLLFYDPVVSADRRTACGTCHSEFWGMTDGLARSVGKGGGLFTGPGRTGPNLTRRNAPTLWNVAFGEVFHWDGRAPTLEAQVRLPFEAPEELGRPIEEVIAEVAGIDDYAARFAAAFPGEEPAVTEDTFARAIASFERTLISRRGMYDAYVAGDTGALSRKLKQGLFLFSEVGCAGCHVPPLFSSDRFADRGVPAVPGVDDRGHAETTGDDADAGKFKVPTLRNLMESGPYFHTGGARSVEDAVRHEAERSEADDGARHLTEDELEALSAFVEKALFDKRENPARPGRVPSGLPIPIDGIGVRR